MEKLQKEFQKKYGFDGVDFVKKAGNEYLGSVKSFGIDKTLEYYAEKKGIDVKIDDAFLKDLIQALAEAGAKFPENQKAYLDVVSGFEISSISVNIPKSKGVLENFKDIVGDDDLRPVMMGVFVSPDGFLVGTDAHKLVKLKNSTYSKDKDKIIDLTAYLKSKGEVLRFIDGKYPNYEAVIPRNNEFKISNLPTYAFYNFCKSAIAVKKLQRSDVFNVNFKEKGVDFSFNPILFSDLLGFALANGFNTFDLEFSSSNRAFVLKFDKDNESLIMPVMIYEEPIGTKFYTFDEVISEFANGGKSKTTKTQTLSKKSEPKQLKKSEPYKKFDGNLDDVTYIPRRDISMVILKNGDELTNADIIDGVYRLKKKFAKGGEVKKGFVTLIFDGKEHKFDATFVDDRLEEVLLPTNSDSPLFQYIEKEFEYFIEDNEGRDVIDMYYSEDAIYSKKGAILGSIEDISNIMEEDNLRTLNLDKDESDLTANWYRDGGRTYAEAEAEWNKKRGIPSKEDAIKFVKENPEILLLKKGGSLKKGLKVAKKYTKLAVKKSKPIVKKGIKSAKIGFDALAKKVAKRYEGSAVQKKYQELYGKIYSKKEAQEVGNKVASKVYRQQQRKK